MPVWAAGELIDDFKGDFNKFILSKNLQKQEESFSDTCSA